MGGGASTRRGMRTRGDGSHSSPGGGRRRRKRRGWTRKEEEEAAASVAAAEDALARGRAGRAGVGSRAPHGLGMRAPGV